MNLIPARLLKHSVSPCSTPSTLLPTSLSDYFHCPLHNDHQLSRVLSQRLEQIQLPSGFTFSSIPTHAKWNHPISQSWSIASLGFPQKQYSLVVAEADAGEESLVLVRGCYWKALGVGSTEGG